MNENVKNKLWLVVVLLLIFVALSWLQQSKKPTDLNQGNQQKTASEVAADNTKKPEDQVLFIPKLGAWAPIIYAETQDEFQIQKNLISGVVHLPNTAKPGEVGNAYIIGHAVNYSFVVSKYNEAFAKLSELQAGDTIAVIDQSGQMEFKVTTLIRTHSADFTTQTQATNGKRLLSLQAFYPANQAIDRYVVVAELQLH